MPTLVLKNNTPLDILIADVGYVIPASGSDTFTNAGNLRALSASDDVRALLAAGTLTANDGIADLGAAQASSYLAFLYASGGFDPPTEERDALPIPESRVTGNSTRVAQTAFDGASYFLRNAVLFDRIAFRVLNQDAGLAGTLRMLLFQGPVGMSGSAAGALRRVATLSGFNPMSGGVNTTFEAPVAEGTVRLFPGTLYVLWGRDSALGTITLRTYTTQMNDLVNQNVPAALHPTTFTTGIAATTLPSTFDPRESGDANGSALDVTPVFRLRKT